MKVDMVLVRMLARPVPRVARMARAAQRRGLSVQYLGAHREPGLSAAEVWEGIPTRRVGPYLPNLNGKGVLKYLYGILAFNAHVFGQLVRYRPRCVHASDIETVPSALLYRIMFRKQVIYNVHDNLADRYNVPLPARRVLNLVEGLAVRASSEALVPEGFRRDALPSWCASKVSVVPNAPEPLEVEAPRPGIGARPFRIVYAGWIDVGRGIPELIRLADENPGLVEVEIAGNGDEKLVAQVERSRARYLGYLSHSDTLERFRDADFVAAIYAPTRPINRSAAPNKLAESLALGRPVITNSEVLMTSAQQFERCSIRLPHARMAELPKALERLRALGDVEYTEMCRRARAAYEELYSWEEMSAGIDCLYDSLGL